MELTPKQKTEELVYFYQNLLTPLSEKKMISFLVDVKNVH